MKNEMCLALIVLATLPVHAQNAASPNCSANSGPTTALALDYAARVDGLLREVHASLQNISERMEAGSLTSEQAQELKLAATRDTISRLDALSAVYDAQLYSTPNATATVSVEELRRETSAAAETPRAPETSDDGN